MKIHLKLVNNLHLKARARHFTDIDLDEPESFHGTDKGPSSIEYLLIGVGGCLASSFEYCLQKNQVEIEDMNIVVDGKLKHTGPDMHLKLIGIDCEILVNVDSKYDKAVNKCIKKFKEHCVINESITHGIPLNTTVFKKEKINKK